MVFLWTTISRMLQLKVDNYFSQGQRFLKLLLQKKTELAVSVTIQSMDGIINMHKNSTASIIFIFRKIRFIDLKECLTGKK